MGPNILNASNNKPQVNDRVRYLAVFLAAAASASEVDDK